MARIPDESHPSQASPDAAQRNARSTQAASIGALVLFVVILAINSGTLWLSRQGGALPSIWVANGVVAGVLLSTARRHWSVLFCAGAAAMFLAHALVLQGMPGHYWYVLANLVEILVVASIIHFYFPTISGDLGGYQRLGYVAITATLAGCAVSTLLAVVVQKLSGDSMLFTRADEWFRPHLLGMVIVGTLTLVAFRERGKLLGGRGRRVAMVRDLAFLAALTLGVFAQSRYPLLFLVFPPLLYLVFRYRFPGLVLGVVTVTLITNIGTALGVGPFALIVGSTIQERVLIAQVFLGVTCLVAVPVALVLADSERLSQAVADRENLYSLLANYASDLIVRIARDGTRHYVSPSVRDMLGWTPDEFASNRGGLIHPDDRAAVDEVLALLRESGKSTIVRYRVRNRAGGYQWLEAIGKLAPSPDHPGEIEIVYAARDITERVLAEQALADSEKRLRTIADSMPAIISHIDRDERYTFVNAYAYQVTGRAAERYIGYTVKESRGPDVYVSLKPHIDAALSGHASTFEYEVESPVGKLYLQATYVPAIAADGESTGFYSLTTDITPIKLAEQKLDFLAHHDALTGIANRLSFREQIMASVDRANITHLPLMLIMIDVDYFKHINDTYGHAAGDVALTEVASRLKASIRKTDLLARLGGDEFVVLCHDIEDVATARQLAQKIIDAMVPLAPIGPAGFRITLSMGVALYRDAPSVEALSQRADEALYEAKAAGRNGFRIVTEGI
ncbi:MULTISPECIES: sensor domain-containing diguanylate cyclase [Dyella]|uniref:sensor domain-containing diguanylate cyclase n=1 Tax=Dyella TaxID=231454 RepID=UPI0013F14765|nr:MULTISPECIES: sensor domain-containing diguanylate cyclase [Dyella]